MLLTKVQTLEKGEMKLGITRLTQINSQFLNMPVNKLAAYGRNPVLTQLISTENLDEYLASKMPVIDFLCFIRNMQGNPQYRLLTDLPETGSKRSCSITCMYASIKQYCMLLQNSSSDLTIKLFLYQSVKDLFSSLIESPGLHTSVLSDLLLSIKPKLKFFDLDEEVSLGEVLAVMLAYQRSPWDMAKTSLEDYSKDIINSHVLLTQLFLRPFICAYPQKFKAGLTRLRYLPDYGPDTDDDLLDHCKRKEQLTWPT